MQGRRFGKISSLKTSQLHRNEKAYHLLDEAFIQNLSRGHLQLAVWRRSASNPDPSQVDVKLYGWATEEGTEHLYPLPVSPEVPLVPHAILKVFRCGCSSENSCKSGNSCCDHARLPCSTFCECEAGAICRNPFTTTPAAAHSLMSSSYHVFSTLTIVQ